MIKIQKPAGCKVLELGCGSNRNPATDCAVDFRPGPGVDFPANFEEPLPISSDEWDCVLCVFALEHISYTKIPDFLREVFRVLKPTGKAVFVTSNTEAQIKWIIDHPEGWDGKDFFESASCKLFGDQRHGERQGDRNALADSHKCYFSPTVISQLFCEAGFVDVQVRPFGDRETDLSIEATKSKDEKTELERESERSPWSRSPGMTQMLSGGGAETTKPQKEYVPASSEQLAEEARQWDSREKTPDGWTSVNPKTGEFIDRRPDEPVPMDTREGEAAKVDEAKASLTSPLGIISKAPSVPQDRRKLFDRKYFDMGGIYGPAGYFDFPAHELTARHILMRRPNTVLEIGPGRGYVLKRLQDAGVAFCQGFDISKHCYLTRACNGIIELDACLTPWPHSYNQKDFPIDLCFSIDTLDRIPEEFIPAIAAEMERTCKGGLHGLDFNARQGHGDMSRCTVRPREWWVERLPKGHEVVHKNELEAGQLPREYLEGDGKIKLNIGCATTMFHHGWLNLDVLELGDFARAWGYKYQQCDVRNGLPFGTGSVDLIYCSHALEHLPYRVGMAFLRDCRRVLKPDGGAMRLIVPDAQLLNNIYTESGSRRLSDFNELNAECAESKRNIGKLWALLHQGHESAWDGEYILDALDDSGFLATVTSFRQPSSPEPGLLQIQKEVIDMLPDISLFVDAIPAVG